MNIENLSTLKIHKLTQAQYDRELAAGNIDENALYLTPDEEMDLSGYATIEQLNESISGAMSATNPVGTGSLSMNRNITGINGEVGDYSVALGSGVIASNIASYAEGISSVSSGIASHAEGNFASAIGAASHAEGHYTVARGLTSHAEGYYTIADNLQHASGKYNAEKDAPANADVQDTTFADAIFLVGYGTSETRANAFRISSGGRCFGVKSFGASGADFAELFEWADGNVNNEDRRGLFVTLDGEKIRLANSDDDYIGVISGAQAFIGNTASEEWQGKYLTDIFGDRLSKEIEIPEKIDEETGEVITPARTTTQYVVNPDYNPDEKYIMRENRKEWGTVGLLGQVVVIDDGTCVVGGYCKPSHSGIGTASDSGYRVMKRIDENHIKVLVK